MSQLRGEAQDAGFPRRARKPEGCRVMDYTVKVRQKPGQPNDVERPVPLGKVRCPGCGRIVGNLFSLEGDQQACCAECIRRRRANMKEKGV